MMDKLIELIMEDWRKEKEKENKWILDQAKRSAQLYNDPRYKQLKKQLEDLYKEYGVTNMEEL